MKTSGASDVFTPFSYGKHFPVVDRCAPRHPVWVREFQPPSYNSVYFKTASCAAPQIPLVEGAGIELRAVATWALVSQRHPGVTLR